MTQKHLLTALPIAIIGMIVAATWILAPKTLSVQPTVAPSTPTLDSSTQPTNAPKAAMTLAAPIITKTPGQLQFALASTGSYKPQRVEYYVEGRFVAAAYSAPYSVTVAENSLAAGSHQVTAKIVSDNGEVNTAASSFTSSSNITNIQQPAAGDTTQQSDSDPTDPTPVVTGPTNVAVASVDDLSADAEDDPMSVVLDWSTVTGASAYQVWRDGTQIALISDTSYTDTAVVAGVTYDYAVVTVNGSAVSEPSNVAAVTIPASTSSMPNDDSLAADTDPTDT